MCSIKSHQIHRRIQQRAFNLSQVQWIVLIVLPHPGTAVAAITKAATDRFIIAKMTNRTKNLMVIARQGSYRNNAIDRLGIFGAKCHRRTAAQTVTNDKDWQMRRVFLAQSTTVLRSSGK
jgi:hypothetical protein